MFFLKFLVVATAAVFAFRRSGLWGHPAVRALLRPGPASRRNAPPRSSWTGDRLFLFLVVVAATAVATVILTRMLVLTPSAPHR